MRELTIEARTENLDTVLEFICSELVTASCPNKLLLQIAVAIEEVFVNIASYAYAQKTGNAVIRVSVNKDAVIEFEDFGIPYNPLERSDPDICAKVDERNIGGLGVFMVKNIMDSVEYRYTGNKNLLVMKKLISISCN